MNRSHNIMDILYQQQIGLKKRENILNTLENSFIRDHSFMDYPIDGVSVLSTIAIGVSHDGIYVATTHGDHTVKIFEYDTGNVVHIFTGHPRTPWTVKFHPKNSRLLASGCLGCEVRVWDIVFKACVSWTRYEYSIISLSFHPDGDKMVIASGPELHVWDWTTQLPPTYRQYIGLSPIPARNKQIRQKTISHSRNIRAVLFHPDGSTIYAAAPDPPRLPNAVLTPCRLYAIKYEDTIERRVLDASTPLEHLELWTMSAIIPQIHLYSDGGIDISADGKFLFLCALVLAPPRLVSVKRKQYIDPKSPASPREYLNVDNAQFFSHQNQATNVQFSQVDVLHNYSSPLMGRIGSGTTLPFEPAMFTTPEQLTNLPPVSGGQFPVDLGTVGADEDSPPPPIPFTLQSYSSPLIATNIPFQETTSTSAPLEFSNPLSSQSLLTPDRNSSTTAAQLQGNRNTVGRGPIGFQAFPPYPTAYFNTGVTSQPAHPPARRGRVSSTSNTSSATRVESNSNNDAISSLLNQISYDDLLDMNFEATTSTSSHENANNFLEAIENMENYSKGLLLADPLKEKSMPEGWSVQERLCLFELKRPENNPTALHSPVLLYSKLLTNALMKAVTSVKLSPSNRYGLLGYGVRSQYGNVVEGHRSSHVACELIQLQNMSSVAVMEDNEDEVNIAQFHPQHGNGLLYGTKKGKVRVFRRISQLPPKLDTYVQIATPPSI